MTSVGRRERSDTFLVIAEARIPRFLPREELANFGKCVKFVHWISSDTKTVSADYCYKNNHPHYLRGFIFRRPIGSLDRNEMDSALVAALKASTKLKSILEFGTSNLAIDHAGNSLLNCCREKEPELFRTIATLFS